MSSTPQDPVPAADGPAAAQPAGPVPEAPLLDAVRALSLLERPEHVLHMVNLMLTTVPRDIKLIEAHLQAGERALAHRVLHQLKGFLPMFCTEAFGRELREMTKLCEDGDPAVFDQRFPALRAQLQRLCGEAQAYLQTARD